ncbi:hypothetical protein M2263_004541 [Providencia alcalifaciens]|nr:hypothetical protein [Providencia alcalifaciens]
MIFDSYWLNQVNTKNCITIPAMTDSRAGIGDSAVEMIADHLLS